MEVVATKHTSVVFIEMLYTIKRVEPIQKRVDAEHVLSKEVFVAEVREMTQRWSEEILENLLLRECEWSSHLSQTFIIPKPKKLIMKMDFEMADPSLGTDVTGLGRTRLREEDL
nr:uncharacterized protein LOC128698882 [Cherax quadricarinatus]